MAFQGPLAPGTVINSAAVGTIAWTNPTNAQVLDGVFTTGNDGTVSSTGQYLQATNFGFSIASTATISGIKVEIVRLASSVGSTDYVIDSAVKLVNSSGTVLTTNRAKVNPGVGLDSWPTTSAYATYGSMTDLWGATWAPSDINNSNFGVVLSPAYNDADNIGLTASVDYIQITVFLVGANSFRPSSIRPHPFSPGLAR